MSDSGFDYLGGNYYISATSLLLEYRTFIDSHPTLFKINVCHPYWPKMVYFCEELEKFPEVMKAITRIHVNSQMDFERALFCSWCALLIARLVNLPEENQRLLFLAGLLQDIGKHTPDETIKDFPSKLNGPVATFIDRGLVQDNHPLVSATLVERYLPELSGLSELVLHHHARHDGTGYPKHIGESQLALDSQILIVANELSDRLDSLGGHNQISHTIPNLKLNSMLYFDRAHLNWLRLVEPNLSKKTDISVNGLYDEVEKKVESLEKMLSCLLVVSAELLTHDYDIGVHGLRSMIHRLTCLSTDTGIFDPVLFRKKAAEATNAKTSEGVLPQTEDINKELSTCSVVRDIALILRGLPEVLNRMIYLVDDILSTRKYDVNYALIQNAREQLYKNAKLLEGRRCNIFR